MYEPTPPPNAPREDGRAAVTGNAEEMRRLMAAEEASMTGFFGKIIRFYERWLRRALARPLWLAALCGGAHHWLPTFVIAAWERTCCRPWMKADSSSIT